MRLPPLHEARFVRRLNRFAATVSLNGREVMVHVANSGRLRELLLPGSLCYLTEQPAQPPKDGLRPVSSGDWTGPQAMACGSQRRLTVQSAVRRKTPILVSADARLPNALVWEAWRDGTLPHFEGYPSARREVRYHDSRLDMLLESPAGKCYVEVKSVTLVQDGVAPLPGRAHGPRPPTRFHAGPRRRGGLPRRCRLRHSARRRPRPLPLRRPRPALRRSRFERPSPLAWKPTPSPAP